MKIKEIRPRGGGTCPWRPPRSVNQNIRFDSWGTKCFDTIFLLELYKEALPWHRNKDGKLDDEFLGYPESVSGFTARSSPNEMTTDILG